MHWKYSKSLWHKMMLCNIFVMEKIRINLAVQQSGITSVSLVIIPPQGPLYDCESDAPAEFEIAWENAYI